MTWQRNQEAIDTAASFDGIYALATNLPGRITAGQVLRLYKDQQIVERRHRDLKQTLKVRPIFLHNDDRIYALISIVGISLLIFGLIEARTRAALGDTQQLPGAPEGRAARPPAETSSPRSRPRLTYTTRSTRPSRQKQFDRDKWRREGGQRVVRSGWA